MRLIGKREALTGREHHQGEAKQRVGAPTKTDTPPGDRRGGYLHEFRDGLQPRDNNPRHVKEIFNGLFLFSGRFLRVYSSTS